MIESTADGSLVRVAAFDVDGTLTTHDCVVAFLREVAGTSALVTGLLRHPVSLASAGLRRDRDALKAAAASAVFQGRDLGELDAVAGPFAERVHRSRLRADVVESLNEHLERGDEVVLVSASFEIYLLPLAARLGVEHVLATRLEVGSDGVLTGRLLDGNCRGPEKVARLHGWLDEHHGGRANADVTAYGDSTGDRELLADADTACWVGSGSMPW